MRNTKDGYTPIFRYADELAVKVFRGLGVEPSASHRNYLVPRITTPGLGFRVAKAAPEPR